MSDATFDTLTDVIGIPLVLLAILVLAAAEIGRILHRPVAVKVFTQAALVVVAVAWIGMRFVSLA